MEILIVIFAVAGGVWGLFLLRHIGLWGLTLAGLLAATVFGHIFFHLSFLTIDRALFGLAVVGMILALWLGKAKLHAPTGADLVLLAFMAVLTLNTFTHNWKVEDNAPIGRLLFYYGIPLGYYAISRHFQLQPKHVRAMVITFAVLGVYLSLTAIAEKMEWRWAVYPRYIMDPKFDEFLGRARGPLMNPSGNGVLLSLCLSSLLMMIGWYRGLSQRFLLLLIPLFAVGVFATMTRCVWLAGLIPVIAIVVILVPTAVRRPMIFLMVLGMLGAVGMSLQKLSGFKRDKNVSLSDMKQSAELRPILATIAFRMFQDHPLVGCGLAHYTEASKPYFSERTSEGSLDKGRPYVQHNIVLSLLTEVGLLGLIPFVVANGIWSVQAWQLWRTKTLALEYRQLGLIFLGTIQSYYVIGMFQDVMIIPAINQYLFFLAGMLVNLRQNAMAIRPHATLITPVRGTAPSAGTLQTA